MADVTQMNELMEKGSSDGHKADLKVIVTDEGYDSKGSYQSISEVSAYVAWRFPGRALYGETSRYL